MPRDLFGLVCFCCSAAVRENALANTFMRSADVLRCAVERRNYVWDLLILVDLQFNSGRLPCKNDDNQ